MNMKPKSSSVIMISTLFKVNRIICKTSLGLTSKVLQVRGHNKKNNIQDSEL